MKYLVRVECSDHIAWVTGDDKEQVESMATQIETREVKQKIHDAVWEREIDQISTREVADRFGCSLSVARRVLMDIVQGKSGDDRFRMADDGGVMIGCGATFNYSPMDIDGSKMSNKAPKHYIWFTY